MVDPIILISQLRQRKAIRPGNIHNADGSVTLNHKKHVLLAELLNLQPEIRSNLLKALCVGEDLTLTQPLTRLQGEAVLTTKCWTQSNDCKGNISAESNTMASQPSSMAAMNNRWVATTRLRSPQAVLNGKGSTHAPSKIGAGADVFACT